MKIIISIVLLITALQSTPSMASGLNTTYNLSFVDGVNLITATFDGIANGNLITQLSDVSVYLDGVGFNGNGHLLGSSNVNAYWTGGGATISFDGSQNNFMLADGYYYNVPGSGITNLFNLVSIYKTGNIQTNHTVAFDFSGVQLNNSNWSVTTAVAAVPVPTAVWLFGSAIAGFIGFNRRKLQTA